MSPSPAANRQPCNLISRRQLLQAGGIGALTMAAPGTVAASVDANRGLRGVAADKSCIYVLLCGGPSHLDTWDLKPDAPSEIRGPYKPIATTVPGMRISELHPRMARLTRHFTLIRSMTHPGNISNHFDAMHNCLAGQAGAPQDAPNIGTGGILGSPYAPLFVGSAENNPAKPGFKAPDILTSQETPERMRGRRQLLSSLGRGKSARQREWQDLHQRGFELATSAGPRQAFDIDREDPRVRDR